jgi:C_GCAxxG_C_C family probable redox protein
VTHTEEAEALFAGGFNCAQSVLAAFGVDLGLERDTALKLAAPFGAGMARSGQACGAVTGSLMVIGLKFGAANSWNKIQKARVLTKSRKFMERFRERHRDINCRELIGVDLGTDAGRKEAKRRNVFEARCMNFVRDAAEILDEIV